MVAQVRFLVVEGKSFRCYFLAYHTSCAVVSVFWLQREIVFGYSVSKKDSYSVSLIERRTASKCDYFVRSNTLLLCVSLLSIYHFYQKDQYIFYQRSVKEYIKFLCYTPESSVNFKKG